MLIPSTSWARIWPSLTNMRTLLLLLSVNLLGQTISIVHGDASQTGAIATELQLTTSNVVSGKFSKRCAATFSGDTYAQVLYIPSVSIASGRHNVAIVSTMANNLYAFDAQTCAQLWTVNLGAVWTNYGNCCSGNKIFYGNPMGIVGTPVVDPIALKLYVVNAISTPSYVLSRVDITTGTVEQTRTISGSVTGTGGTGDGGNCFSGSTLSFRAVDNMQVNGLALSPDASKVYIGFGGWENGLPCYHGWIFAYNTASAMTQVGIFCTTPNGDGASPWMSRSAPSIDASGNVYVVTGNGDYDGVANFSECVLKLSATLSLLGSFVNPNGSSDTSVDADFASGRFMLIPGTSLGVAAGKDFSVFLLNTSGMTQVQTFKTLSSGTPAAFTGTYGSVLMNNVAYLLISTGPLYAFQFSSGTFNTTPLYVTTSSFGGHNGQLTGSINSTTNGILWTVTSASSSFTNRNVVGTLRAINASTGAELWNSGQLGTDALGLISKFASPTVAAGQVFAISNSGTMSVYGLTYATQLSGVAVQSGRAVIQ